ncbi:protein MITOFERRINLIKE 1, chloroplastic [Typha angustifolia]|uniref:protein MITOFERRINLIKE 1, chloroplastic n=1 Tax=Typha angustifolia TaxID=59011 RepID=UPI003C2BA933
MDPNPLLLSLSLSSSSSPSPEHDFPSFFSNLNSLLLSSPSPSPRNSNAFFSSTSLSAKPSSRSVFKALSPFDRAVIGGAAGGIAGAFTYVALLPLDAVKTKLQTKSISSLVAPSSSIDAALSILRTHGPLGFYRGVSAVLFGSASSSALYFATCELFKSLLSSLPGSNFPQFLIPPVSGAAGNIVSSAIMVPKELITQRMQAGAQGRSWEVAFRILQKDGILGLYAGYTATILRNLPAGILSYSSFEYLKAFVLSQTGKPNLEPIESVCCGALAGAISASLTTPLDVVKTRLMTQAKGEGSNKVFGMMRQIVVEEGWAGLARGIGPRVLHSACFAALGYFAFETARLAILQKYVEQREKGVAEVDATTA